MLFKALPKLVILDIANKPIKEAKVVANKSIAHLFLDSHSYKLPNKASQPCFQIIKSSIKPAIIVPKIINQAVEDFKLKKAFIVEYIAGTSLKANIVDNVVKNTFIKFSY